ncbi:MAG: hypothetical protein JWM10_728 [Myxococcaceae bacterium]|nr:hypothetical protein [Myxococcaceae bacterium]
MTAFTYQLLIDLYRGHASVVENLSRTHREALRVETPLARFIERVDADVAPRHVVLTGNAGDGKTFAVLAANLRNLRPIYDASAALSRSASADPVVALAGDLRAALARGERLLLAINRGQLERLHAQVRDGGDDLARLVRVAVEQSQLRARWDDAVAGEVAVVDLGLLDSSTPSIINAMIDKALAVDLSGTSPGARACAECALEALRTPHVRRWIERVLGEVASRGGHLTMRHLWSLIAFLITGGRGANSAEPPSIRDAVGARLFDYKGASAEFDVALAAVDPALVPHPHICREVLLGAAPQRARALPGLAALSDDPTFEWEGAAVVRSLVVHDPALQPAASNDSYAQLLHRLQERPEGWVGDMRAITKKLLDGVYATLQLWRAGTWFPAWQTLCYDSLRARTDQGAEGGAASVASTAVDTAALRIALPRCHPSGAEALKGVWRAPYVWLRFERPGAAPAHDALRVTPRLFRALYDDDARARGDLTPSEALTLRRWLSRAPSVSHGDGVRIARPGDQTPLSVQADELSSGNKTRVRWENADGE